jgi:chromosome segregation ATPase
LHDVLNMSTAKAAMAAFEASVDEMAGDERELLRQRDKLMRSLEMKRQEIKTFENNLGFFNSKSKSGEAMLKDMQHRIARLRDDQTNIEKKIALIDQKLN